MFQLSKIKNKHSSTRTTRTT